jgi:hypothetical protein
MLPALLARIAANGSASARSTDRPLTACPTTEAYRSKLLRSALPRWFVQAEVYTAVFTLLLGVSTFFLWRSTAHLAAATDALVSIEKKHGDEEARRAVTAAIRDMTQAQERYRHRRACARFILAIDKALNITAADAGLSAHKAKNSGNSTTVAESALEAVLRDIPIQQGGANTKLSDTARSLSDRYNCLDLPKIDALKQSFGSAVADVGSMIIDFENALEVATQPLASPEIPKDAEKMLRDAFWPDAALDADTLALIRASAIFYYVRDTGNAVTLDKIDEINKVASDQFDTCKLVIKGVCFQDKNDLAPFGLK